MMDKEYEDYLRRLMRNLHQTEADLRQHMRKYSTYSQVKITHRAWAPLRLPKKTPLQQFTEQVFEGDKDNDPEE